MAEPTSGAMTGLVDVILDATGSPDTAVTTPPPYGGGAPYVKWKIEGNGVDSVTYADNASGTLRDFYHGNPVIRLRPNASGNRDFMIGVGFDRNLDGDIDDAGEVVRQMVVTVVKVVFSESALENGFDGSGDTPWLMVPTGGTNTLIANVFPATAASQVNFVSSDTSKATVTPGTASSGPQTVTITGVVKGVADVGAKLNASTQNLATVKADVKDRRNVTVGIHAVSDGALVPTNVPTTAALQAQLNDVWGKQANVFFTVTRSDFSVHYDLDNDGKLLKGDSATGATYDEVEMIQNVEDDGADMSLYYVKAVSAPFAWTYVSTSEAFLGDSRTPVTDAHEIGHALGRTGHNLTPDALMAVASPVRTSKVYKQDWDLVNP